MYQLHFQLFSNERVSALLCCRCNRLHPIWPGKVGQALQTVQLKHAKTVSAEELFRILSKHCHLARVHVVRSSATMRLYDDRQYSGGQRE